MNQMKSKIMETVAIAGMLAITAGSSAVNAQELNGAGATFPHPIYTKWIQAYHNEFPSVTINYQAVGSGAGFAQYKAGTVDFGASDAPLTNAEVASIPRTTFHIPTVAGAVVMTYNIRGVGPGLHLTGENIADIYLGKIKEWNDPRITRENPGRNLPAAPIRVVHRSDSSGTSFIFTSYLSSVSKDWREGPGPGKSVNWPVGIGGSGNPGVAGMVKNSQGSIGYVELAYAIENKLPYASIKNRSGNYVNATIESTSIAAEMGAKKMQRDVRVSIVNGPGVNTYPICGFTYLLVAKIQTNAVKGRALVNYLKWIMQEKQQNMAKTLLYSPLPPAVRAINLKTISEIQIR
jgi:phosphate transport system substrate-binding protein